MDEVPKMDLHKPNGVGRTGSFRKRPLEDNDSAEIVPLKQDRQPDISGGMRVDLSPPPKHTVAGSNPVLDEIELHFQRSLSRVSKWKTSAEEKVKVSNACNLPPLFGTLQERSQKRTNTPSMDTAKTNSVLSSLKPHTRNDVSFANSTSSTISNRLSLSEDLNQVKKSCHSPVKLAMETLPSSPSPGLLHVYPYVVSTPSFSSVPSVLQMNNYVPFTSTARDRLSSRVLDSSTTVRPNIIRDLQTCPAQVSPISTNNPVQVIDLTKTWSTCFPSSVNSSSMPTTAQAVQLQAASQQFRCTALPDVTMANKLSGTSRTDMQVEKVLSRSDGCSLLSNDIQAQVAAASGNHVMLLTSNMVMQQQQQQQQQPYILVNPSDIHLPNVNISASPLVNSCNMFQHGGGGGMAKLVPEMLTPKVGNGYILVSPNSVLQMVSSAGSIVPQTGATTPTLLPNAKQPSTLMSVSSKTVNPFNSTTIGAHKSRKALDDDCIDVMPASVEDHFAKALGEQWSKLSTNSSVPHSTNTAIS